MIRIIANWLKIDTVAETAKNGFKCLKMHSNVYLPKRANKYKQMVNNGNKWPQIANNCKISEITKYGEQITKMSNNVKKCPKTCLEWPKNVKISEQNNVHRFSGSKLPKKNGTTHFHTMFSVIFC